MNQPFRWRIEADRFVFQDKEMERIKLKEFLKVIKKLNYLEKMTWQNVVSAGNSHTHPVKNTQVLADGNKLKTSILSDTELWQLAISQKHRLFGCVNSDGFFCIMLNDPEHHQTKTH